MIKEYLRNLKAKGGYSWQDISRLSGLPEATIRKIFSGETADPRFETVVRLVGAMGGSLNKINEIDKIEEIEKDEDSPTKALIALKEVYEDRIKDIKASATEHVHSLKKDKRILIIAVIVLSVLLAMALVWDLLRGSVGWVRY